MPPVQQIFIRQAGVVTQTFEQAALEGLFSAQAATDAGTRLTLHDWALQMASGELPLADYCRQAAGLAHSSFNTEQAAQTVLGCLRVSLPLRRLLEELAGKFDLWLYCEADRAGLYPALQRLGLDQIFIPDRWLFSPELYPEGGITEMIPALLKRSQASLDRLLWVDDRSPVTSAALRAGLNAVAYVDAFRLRRNLVLRGWLNDNEKKA